MPLHGIRRTQIQLQREQIRRIRVAQRSRRKSIGKLLQTRDGAIERAASVGRLGARCREILAGKIRRIETRARVAVRPILIAIEEDSVSSAKYELRRDLIRK